MKKKVLIVLVLIIGGLQFCYSQMNTHMRMARQADWANQNMQRMFDAATMRNTPSALKQAKKGLKKQDRQTKKFEKKLVTNQNKLATKTDLSPSKKEKLIKDSEELKKEIEDSKILSDFWKDQVKEAEDLRALKKKNRESQKNK